MTLYQTQLHTLCLCFCEHKVKGDRQPPHKTSSPRNILHALNTVNTNSSVWPASGSEFVTPPPLRVQVFIERSCQPDHYKKT